MIVNGGTVVNCCIGNFHTLAHFFSNYSPVSSNNTYACFNWTGLFTTRAPSCRTNTDTGTYTHVPCVDM